MQNEINGGIFFNAVIQGQNITLQLPATVTPSLFGLPRRTSTFAGRDQEFQEMINTLSPSESRNGIVLAVSGMAGVGKTELVLQLAHHVIKESSWFPGGALFVDLAGYDSERRVTPGVALGQLLRSLGIPAEAIPDDTQERARVYHSVLQSYAHQGRRILIVIDNTDSAEQCSLLIPSDDMNAALITSRHTLAIDAARYDLPTLSPDSSQELIQSILRKYSGGKDARAEQESGEVCRIAQLCGYLPLALQIAGALLADSPNRPLSSFAEDLADVQARLDALEREERTVRAVFDLSYKNLQEEHARLFRLLPINAGPDISTETTACLADLEQRVAGRLLESLARAHLIEVGREWGRWRMHDLLRLYADERGMKEGRESERRDATRRLIGYYTETSEAADEILRGGASKVENQNFQKRLGVPLQWFEVEEQNLLAATHLAEVCELTESAYLISMHLGLYLDIRRRVSDSARVANTALRAARQAQNIEWEARALNHVGLSLSSVRRFSEAIGPLREGVKLARKARNQQVECDCLLGLAAAVKGASGPGVAIAPLRRAMDLGRHLKNPITVGTALTNLGSAYRELGWLREAAEAYSESITYHRMSKDRRKEASGYSGLAAALSQMGDIATAVPHFDKAIKIYQEVGDEHGQAIALMNLGSAHMRMGNFKRARQIYEQARFRYQESGDKHGEATTLLNLATLERTAGESEKSRAYFEQAQKMRNET
ncbi:MULTISPECIES: tetratricopeptide repeat protein [unclassified Streptomyces]|uniref:ATP-binding protein n=1 Tax=unclassified Streptomyces TaxID=2593676 RepID=UPI002251C1EF|nr:tetratricopeptide repeat protein [Streptomyces sp. NBC_00103]MCX5371121.1 tetratricopeptide repeat protein [Streptomyces sp. NBC_00103]